MRARPSGFLLALAAAIVVAVTPSTAQRAPIGDAVREFVAVDAPVVALTNARVIDGTGAPVRPGQTIVVVNGAIEAIGSIGDHDRCRLAPASSTWPARP